jgi:hypothetical protein
MKRTLKYIFNTITVVSLLLMIGTVGLWVDSYLQDRHLGFWNLAFSSSEGVFDCGIREESDFLSL